MGRWHADAVRRSGADVAFVVDLEHERAARLASLLRLPPTVATTSFSDALRPNACDAVHICTPLDTHFTLASAALAAGLHVLVEKPLAGSADETAALLEIAEERRLQLVPVHQFLFQSGVQRASRLLPEIGPVLHFDMIACSAGGAGLPASERERIALDILPHAFALLERLVGPRVEDVEWSVVHPDSGELRLLGQFGRASVGIVVSMNGRPTRNDATITCHAGTVHLNLFHGYAVVERGAPSRAQKIARPFTASASGLAAASLNLARRAVSRERAYPGLSELVRRFYISLQGGGPSPISAAETLSVARARDRVATFLDSLPG